LGITTLENEKNIPPRKLLYLPAYPQNTGTLGGGCPARNKDRAHDI